METKLKPFDLEKAKQGAKVVTRNGRPARIICWDRVDATEPIVALVGSYDNEYGKMAEDVCTYTDRGEYMCEEEHNLDLFMAPTTVERWVNVYKNEYKGYYFGDYYNSEQEALRFKIDDEYVATTKITWEE